MDHLLDPQTMLMVVVVTIIGYMMPRVELKRRIRRRQAEILFSLPSTIDLMSIALEGGMSFDQAISCVRRETQGPLAEEFGIELVQVPRRTSQWAELDGGGG